MVLQHLIWQVCEEWSNRNKKQSKLGTFAVHFIRTAVFAEPRECKKYQQVWWTVPEEAGALALAAAAELAAAVAEALNTVWGTRRGIKGTSLLPSAAHSAQLPAP